MLVCIDVVLSVYDIFYTTTGLSVGLSLCCVICLSVLFCGVFIMSIFILINLLN